MLTPTDSVKDRLAAWYHWKDPQSLEQALLVAAAQKVELTEVRRWSAREGFKEEYRTFEKRLKKQRIASPNVATPGYTRTAAC
jgi:hypothetical protein